MVAKENPKFDDSYTGLASYQTFTGGLFVDNNGLEFTGSNIRNFIDFRDISQGSLGDCYLMSTLGEIAEHDPNKITQIITKANNGNYNVTIANNTIEIDNQLPKRAIEEGKLWLTGIDIFAGYNDYVSYDSTNRKGIYKDTEGWVALTEKAYSIINSEIDLGGPKNFEKGKNNYSTIASGNFAGVIQDLYGGQVKVTNQDLHALSADQIIDLFRKNRPTYISTKGSEKKKDKTLISETGLVGNHGYSVRGYDEKRQLFVLFNPWNNSDIDGEGKIISGDFKGAYGQEAYVTLNQLLQAVEKGKANISYFDLPASSSLTLTSDVDINPTLEQPGNILIYDLPLQVHKPNGLSISQIWASDTNGWEDLFSVNFWLENEQGTRINLKTSDVNSFTPFNDNPIWAGVQNLFLSESELNNLSVNTGTYTFKAQAEDRAGLKGDIYSQSIEIKDNLAPVDLLIYEIPTSIKADQTLTVNQIWASDPDGWEDITLIDYWMIAPNGNLIDLKDSNQFTPWEEDPVNYINPDYPEYNTYLTKWAKTDAISFSPTEYAVNGEGIYTFYAQVFDSKGQTIESADSIFRQEIEVLPSDTSTTDLLIYDLPSFVWADQFLYVDQVWAYDADGWGDIGYIDYRIYDPNSQLIELENGTQFTPWEQDNSWANSNVMAFAPEEYAVAGFGVYRFEAQVFDSTGKGSNFVFQQEITVSAPLADNYEINGGNNTRDTSYFLGFDSGIALSNIKGLAVQENEDWYQINVDEGFNTLSADLQYTQTEGNIDLSLYDSNGNLIDSSSTNSGNEQMKTLLSSPGAYSLLVSGDNLGNEYDLQWNVSSEDIKSLDIDGNSQITTTDGLLFYAYESFLGGVVGRDVTAEMTELATNLGLTNGSEITQYIGNNKNNWDIDGNSEVNTTDGLLFYAYESFLGGVTDRDVTNEMNELATNLGLSSNGTDIINVIQTLIS